MRIILLAIAISLISCDFNNHPNRLQIAGQSCGDSLSIELNLYGHDIESAHYATLKGDTNVWFLLNHGYIYNIGIYELNKFEADSFISKTTSLYGFSPSHSIDDMSTEEIWRWDDTISDDYVRIRRTIKDTALPYDLLLGNPTKSEQITERFYVDPEYDFTPMK